MAEFQSSLRSFPRPLDKHRQQNVSHKQAGFRTVVDMIETDAEGVSHRLKRQTRAYLLPTNPAPRNMIQGERFPSPDFQLDRNLS